MNVTEILQIYGNRAQFKYSSHSGLNPGDIVIFAYEKTSRIGLVISSSRTSSGYFLSTKNNLLLNIMELGDLTDSMFVLMVNNLYKKVENCSYNKRTILSSFLGRNSFKTFNIAKIKQLITVEIND